MRNIRIPLIFFLVLFTACKSGNQNQPKKSTDSLNSMIAPEKNTSENLQQEVSDILQLSTGNDTLQLNLSIHAGDHVSIPVDVLSGDSIFAKLFSEDSTANIRFTQIALPDQTFDGPFGRELHYRVKSKGRYAFIIGENLMAGDSWEGSFSLKAWVK